MKGFNMNHSAREVCIHYDLVLPTGMGEVTECESAGWCTQITVNSTSILK